MYSATADLVRRLKKKSLVHVIWLLSQNTAMEDSTDKIIAWGNLTALTMRILLWKKIPFYELSFLLQTSYFIKTWPSESRRFMIYHIWSFPQISIFLYRKSNLKEEL